MFDYIETKHIIIAKNIEKAAKILMGICAFMATIISFAIVFSMVFESILFFKSYPIIDFLFGTHWAPQFEGLSDNNSSQGAFGILPLVQGTLVITFIALSVAVPFGIASAIYFAEFSSNKFRKIAKSILEILAGIPTVVYGFFTILFLSPILNSVGTFLGIPITSESALSAGIVMGIMIIPFISSLSDDAIRSVPDSLRQASYGLGATKAETVINVILPAALPGIIAAFILAFSRAIGETMIVVMAAGMMAKSSFNPFESLTTITVQIATALTGDQEFDSLKTLSTFALGLFLFIVTLLSNIWVIYITKKYSEKY